MSMFFRKAVVSFLKAVAEEASGGGATLKHDLVMYVHGDPDKSPLFRFGFGDHDYREVVFSPKADEPSQDVPIEQAADALCLYLFGPPAVKPRVESVPPVVAISVEDDAALRAAGVRIPPLESGVQVRVADVYPRLVAPSPEDLQQDKGEGYGKEEGR